jgi:predicted HAD superfamily Cof-like phosphohydrolase
LQDNSNEYLFYGNIFRNYINKNKMDKLDCLNQVADFHRTFHHPIEKTPIIPAQKRCELRVELISEELKEFVEAIENNDLVEVADALCDIQYVLSGAILEFGLGDKFRELFDEVQRSNMSKACANIEEAEATVAHYLNKGFECYYKKDGDRYLVYRTRRRT